MKWTRGCSFSRAEAESTTLKELLERYLAEVTPLKKGTAPESARIQAFKKQPLAQRFVAGIRDVDIARYRDERLHKVCPGTAKPGPAGYCLVTMATTAKKPGY